MALSCMEVGGGREEVLCVSSQVVLMNSVLRLWTEKNTLLRLNYYSAIYPTSITNVARHHFLLLETMSGPEGAGKLLLRRW